MIFYQFTEHVLGGKVAWMKVKIYRYLIIIEKGDENYGAFSPDLPGCVAVGDTPEEVEKNMQDAIKMHIQGIIEDH